MEIEIASPNEKEKMQMRQYQAQVAPLAQQQKGMAGQMGNMVKKKLMSDAAGAGAKAITAGAKQGMSSMLAPTVGSAIEGGAVLGPTAGAGSMAALGTAVPYVGAGLLAGKALGLFNQGGQVGPLSTQYHAEGGKPMNTPEMKKLLEGLTLDELYKEKYGDASIENFIKQHTGTQYKAQGGMTQDQAMALMNNQPDPDELYNEIVAESMTEAAQGQIPPTPTMRPPLMVDPLGADTTYSPYNMMRPDNVPNT